MDEKIGIKCHLFQKREPAVGSIIGRINETNKIEEKAKLAEELLKEADVLLSCPEYAPNKTDCLNCHLVYKLRRRTAVLIIETEELEE